MDNQDQPNHDQSDDLVKADARAFVEANGLHPDEKAQALSESHQSPADPDNPVAKAVQHAQVIRAENYKRKPVFLYVAIAVFLVLIVALSLALSSKPQNNSGGSNSSGGVLAVPTPAKSDTQGLSNQAQQDIKTCSNVINATIEC